MKLSYGGGYSISIDSGDPRKGRGRRDEGAAKVNVDDSRLITFVRHPLDRLVSAYYGIWRGKKHSLPIDEFVDRVCGYNPLEVDKHVRPQWTFIYKQPYFIGKFESLLSDWEKLMGEFTYLLPLQHKNSSNHPHWEKVFSKEARVKAEDYYAKDYEMFGYG